MQILASLQPATTYNVISTKYAIIGVVASIDFSVAHISVLYTFSPLVHDVLVLAVTQYSKYAVLLSIVFIVPVLVYRYGQI